MRQTVKCWLGVVLLTTGGCLYFEEMNHAPTGQIALNQASSKLVKGGFAVLEARVSDEEQHDLTYEWKVQVTRLVDSQRCHLTARSGPDNCQGAKPTVVWSGDDATARRLTLDKLPYRGDYQVQLTAADERGAKHSQSYTFTVANDPPKIKLLVSVDPDYKGLDRVPDASGGNPVHAHYLVRVSERKDELTDLEGDLICGSKAKVTWAIQRPAGLKLEYAKTKSCQGKQVLDRYRFRFVASSLTAPTKVVLSAKVDDGYQGQATATADLTLAPDRPPCIDAASHWSVVQAAGTVPVIHSQQTLFEVPFVQDDVWEPWSYHWTWQVDEGQGFVPIAGQAGAKYYMPAWFRSPGTSLRLRVVVRSSATASMPGCPQSKDLCQQHKGLPANCYQWVVWKVKFI